jgi:hypothetical protein
MAKADRLVTDRTTRRAARTRHGRASTRPWGDAARVPRKTRQVGCERTRLIRRGSITSETLMRRRDLLTRLLESEKAERKQEQQQARSRAGQRKRKKLPYTSFDKYIKQKNMETELIKTVPVEMPAYYIEKSKQYFHSIEK